MNRMMPTTPHEAHLLAAAIGRDAANRQMRKAGRTSWNRSDADLAATEMQDMYRVFNLLNAEQWMPEGYEWTMGDDGNLQPTATATKVAA